MRFLSPGFEGKYASEYEKAAKMAGSASELPVQVTRQ